MGGLEMLIRSRSKRRPRADHIMVEQCHTESLPFKPLLYIGRSKDEVLLRLMEGMSPRVTRNST